MATLDCRQGTHRGQTTYRLQIAHILDADADRSLDPAGLAEEVGCTPRTAERYCEEWRGIKFHHRPERHQGYEFPEKQAMCRILLDAVEDWKSGRPCDGRCSDKGGHHCAPVAGEFLQSILGRTMLDLVGYDSDFVLRHLGVVNDDDAVGN